MSFTQRSIVSELNQDTKQFSTVVYGSCDSVYLKLLLVTLSNKDQVGGETILSPKSKKPATVYSNNYLWTLKMQNPYSLIVEEVFL